MFQALEQARLGDRKWTEGNLGRHPNERDEKGKQDEGQVDGHPGDKELGWHLGKSEANHQDQRVPTEGPDRGRRRGDDAEYEDEQPYELRLSRKVMNGAVPVIVQRVGMGSAHPANRLGSRRRRNRVAMPRPTANVAITPIVPARTVPSLSLSTPLTP